MAKEHLKPVKKGQILNPWGRCGKDGNGGKTSKTLKDLLKQKINEIDPETGKSFAELIIEQGLRQAKRGDLKFIELLWYRLEGKPRQEIDQTITGNSSGLGVVILPSKDNIVEAEIVEEE